MVIILNAQNHVGNLLIGTAHTSKYGTAGADCQQSRMDSSGVNIPLIPAPNPTRFFA